MPSQTYTDSEVIFLRKTDYNRARAAEYAKKWALARNPRYMNFDGMGGDCTNFASQCIYAGSGIMNFQKDVGWYYNSPEDRAAAWSGAQYLNNFLMRNKGVGPVAEKADISSLQIGDLIQLNNGQSFYHSLFIAGFRDGEPLVCTHTADSYMRPFGTFYYYSAEGVHITGVNIW